MNPDLDLNNWLESEICERISNGCERPANTSEQIEYSKYAEKKKELHVHVSGLSEEGGSGDQGQQLLQLCLNVHVTTMQGRGRHYAVGTHATSC